MKTENALKRKSRALYKNTKEIILFFEDQISENLVWYRKGNLMYLNNPQSKFCVFYDAEVFQKIC